ncbi:MAG: DUF2007 domain-containing protein [Moorellaceae bacterium]
MGKKWVVVAAGPPWEAASLKSVLESAGIPVCLRGEAIGRLYGLSFGPLGQVEVLVPEEEAECARELLRPPEGER